MNWRLFTRLTLILMLFYTLQRGLFLFWNRELFQNVDFMTLLEAFFVGFRFDAVAVSWIMIVALLWSWAVRKWLWLPVIGLSFFFYCLSIIDNELWDFFGRRLTVSVLGMFGEAQGKAGAMASAYLGWILLGLMLAVPFMILIFKSTKNYKFKFSWLSSIAMILILVLASRGGMQKKPLSLAQAQHFEDSALNLLTLNTTFTVVKSNSALKLEKMKFMDSDRANRLMNANLAQNSIQLNYDFKNSNVVILILESFSTEYIEQKKYTPYLNELMQKSLVFSNSLANGRRSIEGVAAILAGVPSLMDEPFISSEYSTNQVEGIARIFQSKGYETSFYHGGENGTMHFDSFALKLGFEKYFGSQQYPNPNDHDGVWGIWDRPYFQYFADELSKKKKPFFSVMFTLTSHQPYHVPNSEKERFPEQPEHPILKSVMYTDSALKDFFEKAEKQEWFKNTLFILVADHTGPLVFESIDNPLVSYRVPIIFYHPQIQKWPDGLQQDKTLAQQVDLPVTLFDLFQFADARSTLFSRSLMKPGPRNFAVFNGGNYYFSDGNTLLVETNKKQKFLNLQDLTTVQPNPVLVEILQGYQQAFSEAMWENGLVK